MLLLGQEQSHNTLSAEQKKDGWQLLFDGDSFIGWQDPSKLKPAGDSWTIENGCIKTKSHPQITEDLLTEQKFGDYELEWDWRISPGGNSGVKYRIQSIPILCKASIGGMKGKFEFMVDAALEKKAFDRSLIQAGDKAQLYTVGLEYQMIDDANHPDARRGGLYQTGSLYGMIERTQPKALPVGQFNHSRLVVKGDHVEHWVNGTKVVDASLTDPEIAAHMAKRWGKNSPTYKLLVEQTNKRTQLGLQNHGDEAWFRDIRIRPQ